MSSISSISKNISKRSLTFNKSFMISIALHAVLIFGISITTYYKLPIFNESPIINVKLANSNQDYMTNISSEGVDNSKKELLNYIKESNKKIVSDLEKLELDNFLKYLQTNFGTNITNKILCTNCNNFWAKNNKSLAAHQKKCNSKTINMNF